MENINYFFLSFFFVAEVHFGEMNKGGRGIRSGLGICTCNDMMQCTCGLDSFQINGSRDRSTSRKDGKDGSKWKKDREREFVPVVSDARKGEL